jgi:cytochrome c oxidase accessory protein FixG
MWKKYRRVAELFQAAVIVGLPFLRIRGASAFRFDIPELKLYFFGTVIWINEFYLFLLAVLFFLILIVFITTTFGRIWCGWLCPQTVLLDISGDLSRPFPFRFRDSVQKVVLLPLSALVSLTLIWYFVPPLETVRALFSSKVITGFFLVQWIIIYAELAFLGRRFCTTICPYSMLQNGLFDRNTLVIAFDVNRKEGCMGCDKCVHVCPVRMDIKKGLRRECVACAECIDACISMTRPRGISPFIGYRGRILRPKTIFVGAVTLIMGMGLLFFTYTRPSISVVVSRDPQQPVKDLNRYTCSIQNNTETERRVHISIKDGFILIGERDVTIPPYAIYKGKVMVKATGEADRVIFVFKYDGNKILEKEVGFL